MLEARKCTYRVGNKALVRDVSIRLEPGCVTAFLGPNGAGKSTLIKLLSGQLKPSIGEVFIGPDLLASLNPMQLARRRAVLAQSRKVGFPFAALDVVLFGRHPHSASVKVSSADVDVAMGALGETDAAHLQDRIYNTLSGGEAARVDLARVLAQDTEIVLLDEPTNHLDPKHQVGILQLCRRLAKAGKTIVVCMHDLNLCAHYCDQVLLMKDGEAVAFGPPECTLTEAVLEDVYGIPFMIIQNSEVPICIVPRAPAAGGAELLVAAV